MKTILILLFATFGLVGCASPYGLLGFSQGLQAHSPYETCTREPDHDVVCGQPAPPAAGIVPCQALPAPITMPQQQPARQELVRTPDGTYRVMNVPQFTQTPPLPPPC